MFIILSLIFPLIILIFEIVIISTQYGKTCDQPLMTIFIGECIFAFFTFLYFIGHAIYKIFILKIFHNQTKLKLKFDDSIQITKKTIKSKDAEVFDLNKGDLDNVKEPKKPKKSIFKDLRKSW